MVSKKRGLGRGLDALLADVNQEDSNVNLDDSLQHFPLDMICLLYTSPSPRDRG